VAKEVPCLFEEQSHAVLLGRTSMWDKKYTLGTAAALRDLQQKGSVPHGPQRCFLNAIIVELAALPVAPGSGSLTATMRRGLVVCALNVLYG